MTRFEQFFRVWLRRAPMPERVLAGVAAVIAVALLVWGLAPSSTSRTSTGVTASAGGAAPGASSAGAASPGVNPGAPAAQSQATTAPGAQTGAGGATNQSTSAAGARRCAPTPPNNPAVTDTEIRVVIGVLNLGGAASNATFGFPSPDEQRADYQTVIDSINKAGGAACRKLVATFIEANLADPNAENKACLDATSAKAFILINGNRNSNACYFRAKLPVLNGLGAGRVSEMTQLYPYVFSISSQDAIARNGVLALKSMGLIGTAAPNAKIGFPHTSCQQDEISYFDTLLKQAGVTSSQLVEYNFGCPSGFVPPSDIQQAILKFKTAGVDRVIPFEMVSDFANFTRQVRTQDFKPHYLLVDTDGIIENSYGPLSPDSDNVDGAVGIASSATAEEHTPGFQPASGTAKCNAIFAAVGRPPVYQHPDGYGGNACSQVWAVAAMIDHAPSLNATDLVKGLQAAQAAGQVLTSYPEGPVANASPGTFVGGQHWRPMQYFGSCKCWQLTKRDFQPAFP